MGKSSSSALVGYTGFVGGNLAAAGKFDGLYNSKNITEAYGTEPDLLVYAGLSAEKYLANQNPEEDWKKILQAEENIRRISPEKLVLISTIDVFRNPVLVDEKSEIETEALQPYGLHRYRLEEWVRKEYPDALIVRLPALFGRGLKKNFIYDFIHVIPFMLRKEKFAELSEKEPVLSDFYSSQENGFYRLKEEGKGSEELKAVFRRLGFSALSFTDSRSSYQFYDLSRLWSDLQHALELEIPLWHPATEPVTAGEVYRFLTGQEFVNELAGHPAQYDYRTVYAKEFGGRDGCPDGCQNGYMMGKNEVLKRIQKFVQEG